MNLLTQARLSAALATGRAARVASRLRGGGSALPGLVAETIDPSVLRHTLACVPRGIVVVTGTNGKTTTTKMLVAILREHGLNVFTNPTGSNFTRGVISALLTEVDWRGNLEADVAVLELDEAHALHFAAIVPPTHSLLLNVARDQLDRFAEIDFTAGLLSSLAESTTEAVVLNADDAFVSRIPPKLDRAVSIHWFGMDPTIADRLPEIQEADVRFDDPSDAPTMGTDDGLLLTHDAHSFTVRYPGGTDVGPVKLKQRGLAAMINATAASTMARVVLADDFVAATTLAALSAVDPPFGRGEVIDINGAPLELVLVKNPAGFTVALGTYDSAPEATMIAINDNYADGRDVSWLYDVSFASLRTRGVAMTSGVRGWDMALRLQYDDVPVEATEVDLDLALDVFLEQHVGEATRLFCTYTAMMHLRRRLAITYDVTRFGEEHE